MLGRWQGTFCAGISTRNIERGVRGVDYVVNVRSFAQGRSDRGGVWGGVTPLQLAQAEKIR